MNKYNIDHKFTAIDSLRSVKAEDPSHESRVKACTFALKNDQDGEILRMLGLADCEEEARERLGS